jgi:hypothetical protein
MKEAIKGNACQSIIMRRQLFSLLLFCDDIVGKSKHGLFHVNQLIVVFECHTQHDSLRSEPYKMCLWDLALTTKESGFVIQVKASILIESKY